MDTGIRTRKIMVAFAVLTALWGCQSGVNTTVPDNLVGIWETSESRYQDRFMELKKDVVIFGTGDGNQSIHSIRKVKTASQDERILYTVYYLDEEGGEYFFSFFYSPTGRVITLKNRDEIEWKKNS
jgi:hypothetical protein